MHFSTGRTMNEIQLTEADKDRIKTDIKLTSIIGLIFCVALIVLVLIIPLILYFFGKTADGFGRRSLFIIGGLSLPFIAISWTNILKFIDLRIGKKMNIKTQDYEIEKTKEGFILKTKSPLKLKLDLWDEMPPLIKVTEPITFELTKLSKTLLFISQDTVNLLEKIEDEIDKEIQDEFK
jgi:hypothetical protein